MCVWGVRGGEGGRGMCKCTCIRYVRLKPLMQLMQLENAVSVCVGGEGGGRGMCKCTCIRYVRLKPLMQLMQLENAVSVCV